MKVMCMYLPQYHTFPENDAWWGKGYTEWTSVKAAKPLMKEHHQPKVPLGQRYYDLVKEGVKTWAWQASMAEKYGIYGFSIYQYWFCGKQLMEKPMEILLEHKEIPLRYQICWANETWTRTWYGLENEVLMKQEYGEQKEWEAHFSYLLPFFRDERYIKIEGKPVFQIYRTTDIKDLKEMKKYFEKRAREEGFPGIYFVGGKTAGEQETRTNLLDGYYTFEPGYTLKHGLSAMQQKKYECSVLVKSIMNRFCKRKRLERMIPIKWIYQSIEKREYAPHEYPGLIAEWDNTPRRSYKGLLYTGASPERFQKTLAVLKYKLKNRIDDYVYINAWNEWGEGAVLEPEEKSGYAYLEAVRKVQE